MLSNEIKSLLTDGIETTGLVCVDGTPAHSGTGTGEDFAGFTIYAEDIGDVETDKMIETLPCIKFKGNSMPIEYHNDDTTIYQADYSFDIMFPFHHAQMIDNTIHEYNALANWYLEKLQYVLDLWIPAAVSHSAKMNTGGMNMGSISDEHDIIYYAQSFLSVSFGSTGGSI
jgi:hypothetical protein